MKALKRGQKLKAHCEAFAEKASVHSCGRESRLRGAPYLFEGGSMLWYESLWQWTVDRAEDTIWWINENAAKIGGLFLLAVLISCFIFVVMVAMSNQAHAAQWTDEQIVNAIYLAEGGAKAQYAYGIRSVHCETMAEARRICFNTVRNNRKRFASQSKYTDYLEFLASRYCPVGCDNDRGTNKYWVKNVRYFLARGK